MPVACPEMMLIRHAPSDHGGRLCGRTDVPAMISADALRPLQAMLASVPIRVVSPALRCRQTAEALWPGDSDMIQDARLWEQDFGAQDGQPLCRLPELGQLSPEDLAAHCYPGGESFDDMAKRVTPALEHWAECARETGPVAIVAHAGTVRAALAHAMGNAGAALCFEIAPLSLTRIRCLNGGMSVICTNWTP